MQLSTGLKRMSSSFNDNDLQGIGRHGKLRLCFTRQGGKTMLSDSFSTIPMCAFQPFYLDDSGCAYSYIVNPTSGLVGGDKIEIKITIEDNAHGFITTPSATKVYKSSGSQSEQDIDIFVKKDGILEYLPGYVIPFADSLYSQKIKVYMEKSSTAFILDSFATGRSARGEHLSFKEYRSRTEIIYCDEPVVTERISLRPDKEDYNALGFLETFTASAVLYLIFDDLSVQGRLIADIKALLNESDDIIGGVSALPSKGIIVRFLSKGIIPLTRTVYSIFPIFRKKILGIDAPCSLNRFII